MYGQSVRVSKKKPLFPPLKPPLTQAANSHVGKAEAITQRALNKTMLLMRRKILPLRTYSTGLYQYSSTSTIEKEGGHEKSQKNRKELKNKTKSNKLN